MSEKEKKLLFKQADQILFSIYENGNSNKVSSKDKPINLLTSLKLIELIRHKSYVLGENGMLAILDGSVEKYLENLRTEKELDGAIKRLTSHNLKYQFLYGIALLVLGFLLSFVPNELSEDKMTKEIELLHKSISEHTLQRENYEKRLNDMNIVISDLKNEIDSLKNYK